MKNFSVRGALIGVLAVAPACDDDHHHHDDDIAVVVVTGKTASDFQSLADYLNDPTVQSLFTRMPRHAGATPPNVEGLYDALGTVTATSLPGIAPGDPVETIFCLGPPAGSAIEATVVGDPSPGAGGFDIIDAGAQSFIEGSGDFFTVYLAFILGLPDLGSGHCEVHQVEILSGKREADGSLSSLFIGCAVVGVVGACGGVLPDQIQVSQNTAAPPAASCVGGGTPSNPNRVLVEVANFLVTDADVFVNGSFLAAAPSLSSLIFEADPGFTIAYRSVRPLNGSSTPLGVSLAETFVQDAQSAGRFSFYAIDNVTVGLDGFDDVFFAPVIQNRTGSTLSGVTVNSGTSLAQSCGCSLPSSTLSQHVIGYYPYSTAQIAPTAANVVITGPPDFTFNGPFILGRDSGVLSLLLPPGLRDTPQETP